MTDVAPPIDIEWVDVVMQRFVMGSDDAAAPDDERPERQVTVGSLSVSPFVTAHQWRSFGEATGYRTIAETEGSSFARCTDPGEPLVGLDWWATGQTGAAPVVHVAWLDVWEFCRWAGVRLLTEAEWASVALAENWAPGGPWCWCDDWYSVDFHQSDHRVNPTGPNSGTRRVARGGGERRTQRVGVLPDLSAGDLGFRVVRKR